MRRRDFLAGALACLERPLGIDRTYACAFFALMAFSMSLTFYVFKPYLNIMMMCAMSFAGLLPEDVLKARSSQPLQKE